MLSYAEFLKMQFLFLAVLISAKSRSAVTAVTIPFALSCAPIFLVRVPFLTKAMNLFPDMLLQEEHVSEG